jgi:hypothetical protein
MPNRFGCVVQVLAMLVLLPALVAGRELREASDTEAGPRGLACRDAATALRRGTFDLSIGRLTLRDGKACVPTGIKTPPCEWNVALTRVEPQGAGSDHIIAIVTADHQTGSGAWDSVFFYACRKGVLEQVHSRRYLYGAKFSEGQNSELVITSGDWRREDPACCASRERREYFVWDDTSGKVVLRRTEIREFAKR